MDEIRNNLAALIVTYNRKEMLSKCLHALFEQDINDFDIVVVDNASSDGTQELIQQIDNERVLYFNTGANLGGAGGFSYGVKKCYDLGYDYCWMMDDDTLPHKSAISSMIKKIQLIDASYLCSRVVWTDGKACSMNTPPTAKRGCFYNEDSLNLHLIEIQGCSFVSCLIKMKYIKLAGLPIADFFIYGDDVEFTRRLESFAGGYIDLDSVVTHAMPNNNLANIVNCEKERVERYRYGVRNNVYIQRKIENMNLLQIIVQMLKNVFVILLRSRDSKMKRIRVLISSTFSGLFFNPTIERV